MLRQGKADRENPLPRKNNLLTPKSCWRRCRGGSGAVGPRLPPSPPGTYGTAAARCLHAPLLRRGSSHRVLGSCKASPAAGQLPGAGSGPAAVLGGLRRPPSVPARPWRRRRRRRLCSGGWRQGRQRRKEGAGAERVCTGGGPVAAGVSATSEPRQPSPPAPGAARLPRRDGREESGGGMRGWRLGGARGRWKDRTCVLPPRRNFGAGRQPRWNGGGDGGRAALPPETGPPLLAPGPERERGRTPSFPSPLSSISGRENPRQNGTDSLSGHCPSLAPGRAGGTRLDSFSLPISSIPLLTELGDTGQLPTLVSPSRCSTTSGSPSVTGRGVALSKAPAGSSILQLSPGPVLKHQLIPQHWFRESQTGGRGERGEKKGEIE